MVKHLAKLVSLMTPRRRWAQFSLATMFVVVTVMCVSLAVLANRANRQAVAEIKARGGSVNYGKPNGSGVKALSKRFLRRWLPRDYTDEVVGVRFRGQPTVIPLHAFGRLEYLRLEGILVSDIELAPLRTITTLRRLQLLGTRVTNAGAAEFTKALPNCRIETLQPPLIFR